MNHKQAKRERRAHIRALAQYWCHHDGNPEKLREYTARIKAMNVQELIQFHQATLNEIARQSPIRRMIPRQVWSTNKYFDSRED